MAKSTTADDATQGPTTEAEFMALAREHQKETGCSKRESLLAIKQRYPQARAAFANSGRRLTEAGNVVETA